MLTSQQAQQFQGDEVEGPFTVVTEWALADEYDQPGARWYPHTREYDTERDAVRAWENARRFENIRPISITPEPNWSRYSYDGRTPLTKW